MIPHAAMPFIAFALFTPVACAQTWKVDEGFVLAASKALPPGWTVAERSEGEIPYGHHFCGTYKGITGTRLTIVGPKAVAVHWTTETGEARRSNVAVEAIDLWFMPPNYRDSTFAWRCLHRPVQPVEVLSARLVRVYGRTTHRLVLGEIYLREVLPKATFIHWPESPVTDPALISWSNWAAQLASAVSRGSQQP